MVSSITEVNSESEYLTQGVRAKSSCLESSRAETATYGVFSIITMTTAEKDSISDFLMARVGKLFCPVFGRVSRACLALPSR